MTRNGQTDPQAGDSAGRREVAISVLNGERATAAADSRPGGQWAYPRNRRAGSVKDDRPHQDTDAVAALRHRSCYAQCMSYGCRKMATCCMACMCQAHVSSGARRLLSQ